MVKVEVAVWQIAFEAVSLLDIHGLYSALEVRLIYVAYVVDYFAYEEQMMHNYFFDFLLVNFDTSSFQEIL